MHRLLVLAGEKLMKQAETLWKLYSEVNIVPVQWLWYPYIPIGKITLLQGDPGDGKSTMMLHLIAQVSKGGFTPDGQSIGGASRVIYQCSEDGAADTIRPRLEACGANCENIAFIDEEVHDGLTLDDERIRMTIMDYQPKLVVLDPIQAYIGTDADLYTVAKSRKLMRRLSMWASTYDCAIVLIGHLNKNMKGKDLYRGLGSIDVVAAARSVLYVERDTEDEDIRIVHQIKNSLVQHGADMRFEIRQSTGFMWISVPENHQNEPAPAYDPELPKNKHELAAILMSRALAKGDVESTKMLELFKEYKIGRKTIQETKMELGIESYRKMWKWYWHLDLREKTIRENPKNAGQ